MSTAPALYRTLPFKPLEDFELIGEVVDVPMTLIAKKDMPAKDFKELLAYIKANKDKVTLANAGIGSASHLCGLLLMSTIQTEMTTVPYKGTAPAINDLLGGQVDLMCDQTTNTTQYITSGRVKAYGTTSAKRLDTLKDLPTLAESGPARLRGRGVARRVRAQGHAEAGGGQAGRRAAGRDRRSAVRVEDERARLAGRLEGEGVAGGFPHAPDVARSTSGRRSSRRPGSTPTEPSLLHPGRAAQRCAARLRFSALSDAS